MKKIFISLISILMVFSLLMPVSAEDETKPTELPFCVVDGECYSSLQEALSVDGVETIKLLSDAETTPVKINNSMNIDLGNYSLTIVADKNNSANEGINISNGTLKISNGKIID